MTDSATLESPSLEAWREFSRIAYEKAAENIKKNRGGVIDMNIDDLFRVWVCLQLDAIREAALAQKKGG